MKTNFNPQIQGESRREPGRRVVHAWGAQQPSRLYHQTGWTIKKSILLTFYEIYNKFGQLIQLKNFTSKQLK